MSNPFQNIKVIEKTVKKDGVDVVVKTFEITIPAKEHNAKIDEQISYLESLKI